MPPTVVAPVPVLIFKRSGMLAPQRLHFLGAEVAALDHKAERLQVLQVGLAEVAFARRIQWGERQRCMSHLILSCVA